MKPIVIYYSLEGNTAFAAQKIANYLKADTLRLETVKKHPSGNFSKFFFGGMDVIFRRKPKLHPYVFHPDDYDTIILATPVWAGSFVPAICTFLNENQLTNKKIALLASSASGNAQSCLENLKNALKDNQIITTLSLVNPKLKQTEANEKKIKEFCDHLSI